MKARLKQIKDRETGEVCGAKYVFDFAKHMRDALPSASFIGFTGTPIDKEDKDTRGVFGDYVSIYDIQDAVDDGATEIGKPGFETCSMLTRDSGSGRIFHIRVGKMWLNHGAPP